MTKVIQKTFAALEYVIRRGQPVLPDELHQALGITQPTAARLLRELAGLGYLEQPGARKGYTPGPMCHMLSNDKRYEEEFLSFAAPLIRSCAEELGQSVQFAIRRGTSRFILCHYNFNPGFYVDTSRFRFDDLYKTGSGRILLAFAPEAELSSLLDKLGPPAPGDWPEASKSETALRQELGRIRTNRQVEFPRSRCGHFHVYARPLFRNHQFIGAVAANWEPEAKADLNTAYKQRIDLLTKQLGEARKLVIG